jgi:hypothetical protein
MRGFIEEKKHPCELRVDMMNCFLVAFNLACGYLWNGFFISFVFSEIYALPIIINMLYTYC